MKAAQFPAVPAAVESKLWSVRTRYVWLSAAIAAALACSVLLVTAMLFMLADRWLFFTTIESRVMASAITAGLTIVTFAAVLGLQLRSVMNVDRAAAFVEEKVPELEERWSTVTGMASSSLVSRSETGRAMATQVSREAATMESLVHLPRVAPARNAHRAGLLLGVCCLASLVFLAADWGRHTLLLRRLVTPTALNPMTHIQVAGDQTIARGGRFSLSATAAGFAPREATLRIERENGELDRIQLPILKQEGAISYDAEPVHESFRYQLRAGDAVTAWYDVKVVDPPKITEVEFSIRPPEYTRQPPYERSEIPRRAKARAGSQLDLALRVDSRDTDAKVRIVPRGDSNESRAIQLTTDADGWAHYRMLLSEDISLHVDLRNEFGLTNDKPPHCRIQVIPDRPPIARVLTGRDEVAVSPDQVIDIQFEALDDVGIATAQLVVYDDSDLDDSGNPAMIAVQDIDLGDQAHARRVVADTQLDLATLDVEDGDSISYAIRVADSRLADFESSKRGQGDVSGTDENAGEADAASRPPGEGMAGAPAAESADAPPAQDSPPSAAGDASAGDESAEPPMADSNSSAAAPGESPPPTESSDAPSSDAPSPREPDAPADPARRGPPRSEETDSRADAGVALADAERGTPASDSGPRMGPRTGGLSDDVLAAALAELAEGLSDARAESVRQRLVIDASLRMFGDKEFARVREAIGQQFERLTELVVQTELDLGGIADQLAPSDRLQSRHFTELREVDVQLENVELMVGQMRRLTLGTPYDFVGKGVVEIGIADISPARDSLVAALQARDDGGPSEVGAASGRVADAREHLAALRAQYIAVAREHALAESIERVRKMFGEYVAKAMEVMDDVREDFDPLEWNYDDLNFDEEYRQRLAEVLKMRRELLAELSRMLASDPRLLSRFLALNDRRQSSMREELTRLAREQAELTAELRAWNRFAGAGQRREVWAVVAERRLESISELLEGVDFLQQRITSRLPLGVKLEDNAASKLLSVTKGVSSSAQGVVASLQRGGAAEKSPSEAAQQLVRDLEELKAYLVAFANEHGIEADTFVANRQNEVNALLARATDWVRQTELFERRQYHALAGPEQSRLTSETEELAEEMAAAIEDLANFFGGTSPDDVVEAGDRLAEAFEPLILNQTAAAFALQNAQLADAGSQQLRAMAGFNNVQRAFDQLRQIMRKHESERDLTLPDLEDPTLDEFLRMLEEQPDLARLFRRQLGPLDFGFFGRLSGWFDGYHERADDWSDGSSSAMKRAEEARLFAGPEMGHNPLASKLEQSMWQVQSQLPPEQFREAIEQYFEQIRRLGD